MKRVRIPIPWDKVEAKNNEFNFQTYDHLLDLGQEKGIQVTLAIGYKVPRWPECAVPGWSENISSDNFKREILELLENEVNHFKGRPEIVAWQVENEPLLQFGNCQIFGRDFLKEEVDLVKSLDSRPVILTDSGELGVWVTALQFSDLAGTSLYRTVWNPIFGYFRYPFPPIYYYLKAQITKTIFAPNSQGVFISELQAEPWSPKKSLDTISPEDQSKLFTLQDFQEVIDFTKATRIHEQYLWGTEWWYFMKTRGYPEYWEYAKSLFNQESRLQD